MTEIKTRPRAEKKAYQVCAHLTDVPQPRHFLFNNRYCVCFLCSSLITSVHQSFFIHPVPHRFWILAVSFLKGVNLSLAWRSSRIVKGKFIVLCMLILSWKLTSTIGPCAAFALAALLAGVFRSSSSKPFIMRLTVLTLVTILMSLTEQIDFRLERFSFWKLSLFSWRSFHIILSYFFISICFFLFVFFGWFSNGRLRRPACCCVYRPRPLLLSPSFTVFYRSPKSCFATDWRCFFNEARWR